MVLLVRARDLNTVAQNQNGDYGGGFGASFSKGPGELPVQLPVASLLHATPVQPTAPPAAGYMFPTKTDQHTTAAAAKQQAGSLPADSEKLAVLMAGERRTQPPGDSRHVSVFLPMGVGGGETCESWCQGRCFAAQCCRS